MDSLREGCKLRAKSREKVQLRGTWMDPSRGGAATTCCGPFSEAQPRHCLPDNCDCEAESQIAKKKPDVSKCVKFQELPVALALDTPLGNSIPISDDAVMHLAVDELLKRISDRIDVLTRVSEEDIDDPRIYQAFLAEYFAIDRILHCRGAEDPQRANVLLQRAHAERLRFLEEHTALFAHKYGV